MALPRFVRTSLLAGATLFTVGALTPARAQFYEDRHEWRERHEERERDERRWRRHERWEHRRAPVYYAPAYGYAPSYGNSPPPVYYAPRPY